MIRRGVTFIERRDEAAFAALVRRHGSTVWSVCRRLLSQQDAEDAFQATFLVLVRKAASIVQRERVANWLYGVAHQTALQARRNATRRRAREKQVTEMPEPAVVEQDRWDDLRPLLDQELSRLPDKYREAIVLCDLGGKSRKEAAQQLSLPEGTIGSRLARARRMLAKRLARHGLAWSGGALAMVLTAKAASAGVPCSVVSLTIKAASLVAAGETAVGIVSVKAAALTEGVMKAMLLNKLKTTLAALVVLAVICFGGLYTHPIAEAQHGPADQPSAQSKTEQKDTGKEEGTGRNTAISKLQGTWLAVSVEANGRQFSDKALTELKPTLVISGDKFTATAALDKSGEVTWAGTIQLDSTTLPLRFHLHDGRLEFAKTKGVMKTPGVKGIYERKGDTLKVCYGPERPTEFKTKPDSSQKMYVFKRVPKKDADKPDKGNRMGESNKQRG